MCKRCTRKSGRVSGLSSSHELLAFKSSYVPENGWTDETFRTQNGVRLLFDLIKVRRSAMARGVRSLSVSLTKRMRGQVERIVEKVENARVSLDAKASIELSVQQHGDLWAKAIDDVFKTAGMEVMLEVTPSVQSVMTEVHKKTALLIGAPWSDVTETAIKRRVQVVARRVTRINDTTRKKLEKIIKQGIDDKLTVRDVIDLVKKNIPSIATNRVPGIVRTEMGRAADEGTKQALKDSEVVTHVSVVGCEGVEKSAPTYKGIPTCNIQDVPIADVDMLEFHPNHTGAIVPSRFIHDDGTSDRVNPSRGQGPEKGREGVPGDEGPEAIVQE